MEDRISLARSKRRGVGEEQEGMRRRTRNEGQLIKKKANKKCKDRRKTAKPTAVYSANLGRLSNSSLQEKGLDYKIQ